MKYIKTFEAHSIKKNKISREELEAILHKSNLVTLPYFDDESSILHHIEKNFDDSDVAFVSNLPKELTSIDPGGSTAILYTKNKTYVIEDIDEMDFDELVTQFDETPPQ